MLARRYEALPAILLGAAALASAALFTLGAYEIDPFVVLALLAASGFVVVAFVRPAYGVAGALLATSLEIFQVQLPVSSASPAEAGFAVVAVAWLARVVIKPETVVLPSLRDLPVAVLLLAVALGMLVAVDPAPVVRTLILWGLFYLVYLQAQSFSEDEMWHILVAFTIGAGLLGVYGAVKYVQAGNSELFAGGAFTSERAVATFDDPNYYASLLNMALLPALALVVYEFRRFAWLLVPAGATFAGLVFSLSRGAMLGFGMGLLVLLAWRRARLIVLVLGAILVVLTLANANPIVKSDYFGTVEQRLSTLRHPTVESKRPQIWAAAIDMTVQHPFFGIGVNQFEGEAGKRSIYERGSVIENAHEVYLSLAAETGLIGLAAFLAFVIAVAARALAAIGSGSAVALGLTAALLAFLVQGLTSAQVRVAVLVAVFFLYAGMVTGLADRARHSVPERSSTRPRLGAAGTADLR